MCALSILLSACAPLISAPLPELGAPEFGIVTSKKILTVRTGETRAERAAWALASLDPFVLATAVVAVEDDFGKSQIYEYTLDTKSPPPNASVSLQSRYIVEAGQCVMFRRSADTQYVIIVAHDLKKCTERTP